MIENQLPQIANLVAKGTLQVSVIYGKNTDRNFVVFSSQQVLHFDLEVTY